MQISVLMSVYKSEKPICIDRALRSVWDDQTMKPEEIILVQDGPLGKELMEVINLWKAKLGEHLVTLQNKANLGLTKSLNKGLVYAKGELIARMDSDDISHPMRFERQIKFLLMIIHLMWFYVQVILENMTVKETLFMFREKIFKLSTWDTE